LLYAPIQVTAAVQLGQLLDDQPTGQRAVLMATHAIGHSPQTPFRQRQKGVLVAAAYLAGVGPGVTPPGSQQIHHNLAGKLKPRSRLRSNGFGERWLCSR